MLLAHAEGQIENFKCLFPVKNPSKSSRKNFGSFLRKFLVDDDDDDDEE